MVSIRSWMISIKAVLISSGVIAVALLLKVYVPVAVDFSVSRAPILWSLLFSWLKPPYLYFITNGIIITIAASSRLYRSSGPRNGEEDEIISEGGRIQTEQIFHQAQPRQMVVMAVDPVSDFRFETVSLPLLIEDAEESAAAVVNKIDTLEEDEVSDAEAMAEDEEEEQKKKKKGVVVKSSDLVVDGRDEIVEPMLWIDSPENESENLPPPEKPLVSTRFGHRKSVKSSPEGVAMALRRVAKPKRHESLEYTWKMITEGKSKPLTRQFKQYDTWQNQGREMAEFNKSETLRDRTNYYKSPEKVRMRKEPSLSQDELNRRVEAFIKKFNEDMRLQRLESLKQYKEIVSRGI